MLTKPIGVSSLLLLFASTQAYASQLAQPYTNNMQSINTYAMGATAFNFASPTAFPSMENIAYRYIVNPINPNLKFNWNNNIP